MAYALEGVGDVAADTHCRRRGVGKFGVGGLQILQLTHHCIEVEIRYLGRVFDIIQMVVVVELATQLFDMLPYLLFRYHTLYNNPHEDTHFVAIKAIKTKKMKKKLQKACSIIFLLILAQNFRTILL